LNIIGDSYGKGVSVLKACLDYSEDPVWSCEKLFSRTKTEPFYWLRIHCSLSKLIWEVAWFFHHHVIWRQLGRKIQMFTTSCWILAIIHPDFFKILKTLSGETRILGRKIPLKDRYHATILYTRIYKEFDSAQYNIFSSLVSFLKITI